MKGLLLKYRRYTIAKMGVNPDRRNLFDFYYLKETVELRITTTENAE